MTRAVVKVLAHAGIPSDPVRPLSQAPLYGESLQAYRDVPVRTFSDQLDPRPEGMTRWVRLDRYGRALARVADATLHAHPDLPGAESPTCGLVVASQHSCTETNADFDRGFIEKGPRLASPKLFPYTLPGSTASEVAMHFDLGGAYLIFNGGPATALIALTSAVDLLVTSGAQRLLVLSADVLGPATIRTLGQCGDLGSKDRPPLAEACAGIWLARPDDPRPGRTLCIESSMGPARPALERTTTLIDDALRAAGSPPIARRISASIATAHRAIELDALESVLGPGPAIQLAPLVGDAGASVGLFSVGAALDEAEGASLVVACDDGGSAAMVITDE